MSVVIMNVCGQPHAGLRTAKKPKTIKWYRLTKIPPNPRRYCHFNVFFFFLCDLSHSLAYRNGRTLWMNDVSMVQVFDDNSHLIKLRN